MSNECRHSPQRRLLLRERAQLVAGYFEQALRLAQLGIASSAPAAPRGHDLVRFEARVGAG